MSEKNKQTSNALVSAGKKRKMAAVFLVAAFALLLVASAINWGIVTGWGNVKISRLNLNGTNNTSFSALLYTPKNASDDTPAPAIICFHGNAGNARNHESWAVEFSRRGFVVLSVDQYGAGNSDNFTDEWLSTEAFVSVGEVYYQYLLTLPFVNSEEIVVGSHSMGNSPAFSLAGKYDALAVVAASPVTFRVSEEYNEYWNNYRGNYLCATGVVETAAAERNKEDAMTILQNRGYADYEAGTPCEIGRLYGSFETGDAYCLILEENRIHEAAFVSETTIGNLLWFAQESVGKENVPNYIDSTEQIWKYKDYTGLAGIYAFALFLCALALFLIEYVPAFHVVSQPMPRNIGLRGMGMVISIVCGIIFPYIVLKTGGLGLIKLFGDTKTIPGVRMTYSNHAFAMTIGLNVMGLLTFLLFWFTDGKKQNAELCDLGLTTAGSKAVNWNMIAKSLLVALITLAIGWAYLKLQSEVLGTDFYAWFFGFKEIPIHKLPYYTVYILGWIVCFLLASMAINVERRLPSVGNDLADTIIAIIFNVLLGVFTITLVIVVKWKLQSNGIEDNTFWESFMIDTQRIWGMPVGMGVGIGGSTLLYRKTGNSWLSAFLMGTVCALTCVLYGQIRIAM